MAGQANRQVAACAPAPGRASSDAPPLVNEDVKRTVDLSSHLAKVTAEVVLAHAGSGSSPRAASFLLALEPELEARLAHLGVHHPRPCAGSPVLKRGKGESPAWLWSPTWSLLGGTGASEPCRRWRCARRAMVTGEVRGLSSPASDRTEFRFTKD